jgi:hypothetical protein
MLTRRRFIGVVVVIAALSVAGAAARDEPTNCQEFGKLSGMDMSFRLSDGGLGQVPEGGGPDDYLASDPGHGLRFFFLRADGGWAISWSPDGRSHHLAPIDKKGDGGWVYQRPLPDGGQLPAAVSLPPQWVKLSDGGWLEKQQLLDGGWLCIPDSTAPKSWQK